MPGAKRPTTSEAMRADSQLQLPGEAEARKAPRGLGSLLLRGHELWLRGSIWQCDRCGTSWASIQAVLAAPVESPTGYCRQARPVQALGASK